MSLVTLVPKGWVSETYIRLNDLLININTNVPLASFLIVYFYSRYDNYLQFKKAKVRLLCIKEIVRQ